MSVGDAHGVECPLGNAIDITIEQRGQERFAQLGRIADDPPEVMNGADAVSGKGVRVAEAGAVQNRPAHHVFASPELESQAMFTFRESADAQSGLMRELNPGEEMLMRPGPDGGEGLRW